MAFQSVPGVAEAVVRFTANNELCTLTFYGAHAGYNQGQIDDLAEQMDLWAAAEFRPVLSNQVTYTDVVVRGLEFINDLTAINNTGSAVGSLAFPPLPNLACIAVKRSSTLTGRSARGRVFMPLATNALSADENFITTTMRDAIVDALNEVRVYMATATWVESIVSRYTLGALRPTGVTFTVQQYSMVDLEIDTQRRRMPSK